ncbi:MAG: RloB family protein [Paludibacter sp.]|nr:RloB family protein [Paludibacter sp.]
MAEKHRTYSKSGLERETLPLHPAVKLVNKDVVLPHDPTSEIIYQKPDLQEIPKAFVVIVSGGEDRERRYFKLLSNADRFERIKIDFIADPNKLNPTGMLEIALLKNERLTTSHNEEDDPDRIYLVSDVDQFMDELLEIKPVCSAEKLNLIISNSCFEVWLYYAYHSDFPSFVINPVDIKKISWKFKGWLPTVIRGGVKTNSAIYNIEQNIENAKSNYREDQNGIPELFSTNMYQLAEDLLPFIQPELNKLEVENKETEKKFRSKRNK